MTDESILEKFMIGKSLRYYIIYIICALGSVLPCSASWNSFIINYDKADYGSGSSTWCISTCGHWTFFANQNGMLLYDGVDWMRYPLNNRSEARGVTLFPDKRRAYVGGENEYGYLEVGDNGVMNYHCLSEEVDRKYGRIGNVWDIYEYNEVLYFRGENSIVIKAGDKYSAVRSEESLYSSIMVKGVLYVATLNGVKMLVGHRFVPINGNEVLNGKRINTMVAYRDGFIVGTLNDGLFYCNENGVAPMSTPADAIIDNGEICCMAARNDTIAVGTIHAGVVIIDMKRHAVKHYNEDNGLQNNTVLSIAFDHKGNLWAGLSYGIDYIMLNNPLSYLYCKPHSYGIGYAAMFHDGNLYMGTDRGLYYSKYPVTLNDGKPVMNRIQPISGPSWALYDHNGELFCLHDRAVYVVNGASATKVTDIHGAWSCCPVEGHPDMLFIGVYDGVCLIRKTNGTWRTVGRIKGITESGRYLEQIGPNIIKVYYPTISTAVTFYLDKSLTKVVKSKISKERYEDPSQNMMRQMFDLGDVTGPILKVDNGHDIIPYDRGFMLLEKNKIKSESQHVYIQNIVDMDYDSLLYASNFCNIRPELRLSYSSNNIRISYKTERQTLGAPARYQYRLNDEEWSAYTSLEQKEYNNLHEGGYTFEVKAIFADGSESTDSISFTILPPWYRTWWAYIIYILILANVVYACIRFEIRQRKRALAKKDQQIDNMKVEIDKLEKEKMEQDLRHKSQEIANLMLNMSRKNEILNEVKTDIKHVISKIGLDTPTMSKRSLVLVNNKIDQNIEGDEMMKRFEEEFDLANDNFIKKIMKAHPDLNNNERMMCAYLRMNLQTKEIAPLLNISVRGVESIRYRLRKKFNLNREDSITEYLNRLLSTET